MIKKLTNTEIKSQRLTISESKEIKRFPIYALLDNIRSLYNVGSMFRTSDGARISELILTGFTPTPPRKELQKTSLGATETVPWQHFKNQIDAINYLKSNKIKIVSVELTNKSKNYFDLSKLDFPICVVFGNEISGISKEILENSDESIQIPMFGFKHSLNVSVAFGIILFDLIRILQEDK